MTAPIERKLTTIMSADVSGYSRLMEVDEVATLEMLRAHRTAMFGMIERHRGRVVSTAGDSVLAEFPSVVEAVLAASEIQRELAARNDVVDTARRMEFRIGINLGDVMVEGDDLFGEGVNIAARLQGLAEPGGICISGTVYEQVRNKLSLGYDYVGMRSVKNISEQLPVYRVELESGRIREQPGPSPPQPPPPPPPPRVAPRRAREHARLQASAARAGVLVAILFVIDLLSGKGWWFHWPSMALLGLVGLKVVGDALPPGDSPGRRYRRRAARFGVIALFLFGVDVFSGPGWWFYWPVVGFAAILALQSLRLYGPGAGRT